MRKTSLENITSRGGIITTDFLENMRNEKVKNAHITPKTFTTWLGTPIKNQNELDMIISDTFQQLVERWDSISNYYETYSITDARNKWMLPLLRALGFDPSFNREDITVEGGDRLKFKLSHRGWIHPQAPLVHTVPPQHENLEKRSADNSSKRSLAPKPSPPM